MDRQNILIYNKHNKQNDFYEFIGKEIKNVKKLNIMLIIVIKFITNKLFDIKLKHLAYEIQISFTTDPQTSI